MTTNARTLHEISAVFATTLDNASPREIVAALQQAREKSNDFAIAATGRRHWRRIYDVLKAAYNDN